MSRSTEKIQRQRTAKSPVTEKKLPSTQAVSFIANFKSKANKNTMTQKGSSKPVIVSSPKKQNNSLNLSGKKSAELSNRK